MTPRSVPENSKERTPASPAAGFVVVEPEMSGRPADAADDGRPSFVFDAWLGDDLVRAYPGVLATARLKNLLAAVPDSTGFSLSPARVRGSRFFRQHNPGRRLPRFWSIEVHGTPGRDDVALTEAGDIVVSRRVLDVLLEHRLVQARFAQYEAGPAARRARARR
jgi:hypothetical protein